MKTYKKDVTERCCECNQWVTKQVDVPMPKDGIECLIVENRDKTVDVQIELIRPIHDSDKGQVFVFDKLTRNQSYAICQGLGQMYLKDNTNFTVLENNKDKYQIHDRRHILRTSEVVEGLKSLKKASGQSRRNKVVDK